MKTSTLFLFLICSLATSAQYAGAPDVSFSNDGHASQNLAQVDQTTSMAMQSTGKFLVTLVSSDLVSSITRFNNDGTIDNDFGTNGTINITVANATFISANSVQVMPDDRIVIGFTMGDINFMSYYGCMRLMEDGTPDNTFSLDGIVVTPVDPGALYGGMYGIALQPDGRIISYGVNSNTTDPNILLFRLNVDGTFDNNFGADGYATVAFSEDGDFPNKVLITEDDKIYVAGYTEVPSGGGLDPVFNDLGLACLDINGNPDNNFGVQGIFSENLSDDGDWIKDIVVMDDGSIYAAGSMADGTASNVDGATDFLLCKITSDGQFDLTFDQDGWMKWDVETSNDILSNLLLDNQGRLVMIGTYTSNQGSTGFILQRRMQDGSPDITFGPNEDGEVLDGAGSIYSNAIDAMLQADGKIVIAGYGSFETGLDIILARYNKVGDISAIDEVENDMVLFPNPASDFIQLKTNSNLNNTIYQIIDLEGRCIRSGKFLSGNRIDIAELSAGSYFIQTPTGNYSFIKK